MKVLNNKSIIKDIECENSSSVHFNFNKSGYLYKSDNHFTVFYNVFGHMD